MVGLSKEGHSLDSKTEKSSEKGVPFNSTQTELHTPSQSLQHTFTMQIFRDENLFQKPLSD